MNKVVVILGPTGSGKTEIAVYLAKQFNGEIINADSRQIYKDLKVGVSAPPDSFFEKIPHHLFGVTSIDQPWDAARFSTEGEIAIQQISSRGKIPFVVGGTGFYIKALLFGLFEGIPADLKIREEMKKETGLYDRLKEVDPKAAEKIHPNDSMRLIRALEVFQVTGIPLSEHQARHQFAHAKVSYLKIGLEWERTSLDARLDQRVDEMIDEGLEDEVKGLVKKYDHYYLLKRVIGYREWFPYWEGKMSRDEVIETIKKNSRHFAKRQMTWFRKEKDIEWHAPDDRHAITKKISDFLYS